MSHFLNGTIPSSSLSMTSLALLTDSHLLRLDIAIPKILRAIFTLVKRDRPSLNRVSGNVTGAWEPFGFGLERVPVDGALGVLGTTLVPEESFAGLGAVVL